VSLLEQRLLPPAWLLVTSRGLLLRRLKDLNWLTSKLRPRSTSSLLSRLTSPIQWTWTNSRFSAKAMPKQFSPRNSYKALKLGPNSKISVTYFEWSALSYQKIIIPWRLIDGPESADAVANEILQAPVRRGTRTSISGAILVAMPLFDQDPYRGVRRVIDISGDGPNNDGPPVTPVRDEAVAKGFIINGLPIMVKEPTYRTMDIDNLDWYYEDCVIGGPGSFVAERISRTRSAQNWFERSLTGLQSVRSDRRPKRNHV
jgi:hypothetical protein